MTLIKLGKEFALVKLETDEAYLGYTGAHADEQEYTHEIFESCEEGRKKNWTWAPLLGRWNNSYAVITRHDFFKLNSQEENEFGVVSP